MLSRQRPSRATQPGALALSLALCLTLLLGPGSGQATTAVPLAADPALEARVMTIAEELRCLVCQNETIAGSQADLARDLRAQIREQLQQGRTQSQILDFMVERYGQFVLYRPTLQASTLVLWAGPFLLLLGAVIWLVRRLRQRPAARHETLSPEEAQRVQQLLDKAGS